MVEARPIKSIRLDGGTQPRGSIDKDVVRDYAEAMLAGAAFPPVIVFYDGEDHWLADGFHRIAASQVIKLDEFPMDVQTGTLRDAVLFACGANATHGHRRSNADKRRAVTTLLEDEEWGRWTDREISRQCRVDHKTVSSLRNAVTGDFPSERTYRTKHGTVAVMNTANIGRPQENVVDFDREDHCQRNDRAKQGMKRLQEEAAAKPKSRIDEDIDKRTIMDALEVFRNPPITPRRLVQVSFGPERMDAIELVPLIRNYLSELIKEIENHDKTRASQTALGHSKHCSGTSGQRP